jgi:SAM-dependent methyltransferase
MKRSLARRLPLLRQWVQKLDELEQRYAKLKRQRDNLKAELADTRAVLAPLQREKAEEFAQQHKAQSRLPIPPDGLRLRVHGAADDATFLSVGAAVASHVKRILEEEHRPLHTFERILDFGCGCGRVLRFFEDRPDSCQLFATDVDVEAINWCKDNLVSLARFTTNATHPPLCYENDFFDLVLAISVFTHLPESMEQLWLAELQRIAKPGAILLLSIHGNRSFRNVPASSYEELASRGFCYAHCGGTAGLPDYYQTSFHTEEYVNRHWATLFHVRRIVAIGHQDVVVCEKRIT